jgi:holo-[acyl-carrier protein] synthase
VSVGLDIVEIERLERALQRRPRLAHRLFTDDERAYAGTHARPARQLAARFAAKEAVTKALRMPHFAPRDIEIAHQGTLHLTGAPARRAHDLGVTVDVSLSHERTLAAAVAVTRPGRSASA